MTGLEKYALGRVLYITLAQVLKIFFGVVQRLGKGHGIFINLVH